MSDVRSPKGLKRRTKKIGQNTSKTTVVEKVLVMKTVLKNQRTLSAIVALTLAAIVTLVAGVKSYGETANEGELIFEFDEKELLERAIADLGKESFAIEEEAVQTVKIFNANNELLETVTLTEDQLIEEIITEQRLDQAEFLSAYGNTLVYKISE